MLQALERRPMSFPVAHQPIGLGDVPEGVVGSPVARKIIEVLLEMLNSRLIVV